MEHDNKVIEVFCKNLYDNREKDLFCDLLLKTSDDKRIPVHKIVLRYSISPKFQRLIERQLNKSELYLPICSTQLEIIIKYLYTGDVSVTELSETKALYENAQTFMLPFLQNYSTNKLLNSITLDFSLEYLRHALKFSIQVLEEKCLRLIADNAMKFFNKFLQELAPNELEKIMEIRDKLNIEEIDLYRNIKKWIFFNYNIRKYYIEKILLENIDFLKIPSNIYYDEIENDLELRSHVNFLKKIILINKIKEKSILKKIVNKNYCGSSGQESLYYIPYKCIQINKINIEKECFELEYDNEKYNTTIEYAICNFKYDNKDYFLFSGGVDYDFQDNKLISNCLISNLIWSPSNIKSDGSLKEFPSLLQSRIKHQTIFFDGKIYVCGGYTSINDLENNIYTKTNEYFNFGSEKWYIGPEFVSCKKWFGITALDRCLYAVGGTSCESYVERIDPRVNKWNVISSLCKLTCLNTFPCSESSILCLSAVGSSFIFDIRNNKFTEDVHYDCLRNYKLCDVVKFNNNIYGAYLKGQCIYIRKYDKKYINEQQTLTINSPFPIKLLTIVN